MTTLTFSFLASLLMACGDKDTPEPSSEPSMEPSDDIIDEDGDGIAADEDCDDSDASVGIIDV